MQPSRGLLSQAEKNPSIPFPSPLLSNYGGSGIVLSALPVFFRSVFLGALRVRCYFAPQQGRGEASTLRFQNLLQTTQLGSGRDGKAHAVNCFALWLPPLKAGEQ